VARHPKLQPNTNHANGATKLLAAWLAVTNLQQACKMFESIGLPTGRTVKLPLLHGTGKVIQCGTGYLVLAELFAVDFISHDQVGGVSKGIESFKNGLKDQLAMFPDWNERVESILAEGDLVAIRFTSTGTMRGDFAGWPGFLPPIKAKEQREVMAEIAIFRIRDGKIAEEWNQNDLVGACRQLGVTYPGVSDPK
jgi:predicted ester cyclase